MKRLLLALTLLATSGCGSTVEPAASLQASFADGSGSYAIDVTFDEESGYPIRFRCMSGCENPVETVVRSGDFPLGLFQREAGDVVYYLSGSGLAYQVRAWRLTATSVDELLDVSSRSRPDFSHDASGNTVIETSEATGGSQPRTNVSWTFRDEQFIRTFRDVDEGQ